MSGKGHTTLTSAFNIMGTAFGLEVPSFLSPRGQAVDTTYRCIPTSVSVLVLKALDGRWNGNL